MFGHLGYVERFNITKPTLLRFLLTVRRAYRKVPYHNWRYGALPPPRSRALARSWADSRHACAGAEHRHAFSVAHFCFVVLATQSVHRYLEDHEQLGLLLAAVCHDIDHRGRNNAFMMKANNAIAQLYDAGSVMEHHHLAFTVTLLSDPAVNVLANVAPSVYTAVLQQVRHVILATDLATHFKERGAIRKLVNDMPAYVPCSFSSPRFPAQATAALTRTRSPPPFPESYRIVGTIAPTSTTATCSRRSS